MSTPHTKSDVKERQLECWRVWVRPKASDKKAKKRGHGMLGSYLFGVKK